MITQKDLRWESLAQKMLKINNHPKYKMISLVIRGGRLISVGTNKESAPKRFIKAHREGLKLHAEVDSLIGVDKSTTKNATLYIIGETLAGNKMTTKPCSTCLGFIEKMGLRRIVYQDKGKLVELK